MQRPGGVRPVLLALAAVLAMEFLAEALRPVLTRPILPVAYVDFDPPGWIIAAAVRAQLERNGLAVETPRFLVRPSRFSGEELRRLAMPLPVKGKGLRTRVRDWLRQSGGVEGRALGLYADFMRPVERVVAAFQEETGLEEVTE